MTSVFDLVLCFLEGCLAPKDFITQFKKDEAVYTWLQSIVPKGKKYYICHITPNAYGQNSHILEEIPYDVKIAFRNIERQSHDSPWRLYYYFHMELAKLIEEAFPNEKLKLRDDIKERYFFELNAIPRYVCSKEVYESGIVDNVIDNLPNEMSKDEKTIVCRKTINDIFHVRSRYPCWRRESEWPIGSLGFPMLFVAQYSDGQGKYTYEFEDVCNGEKRLVVQKS